MTLEEYEAQFLTTQAVAEQAEAVEWFYSEACANCSCPDEVFDGADL